MAEATCKRCGVEYEPTNKKQRYCTKRCQKAGEHERYYAKRVAMDCSHCGATFLGRRWGSDAEHQRRYCSPNCDASAKKERYLKVCPRHGELGVVSCSVCERERRDRQEVREAKRLPLNILLADPCAYCGEPPTGIDHIVPRCIGGEDVWTNWTACCQRCNARKGTLPLLGFLLYLQVDKRKRPLEEEMGLIQRLRPV